MAWSTSPSSLAPTFASASDAATANNTALLVAVVGILGTLAAAITTQWMTMKREERRSKWEHLHKDRLDAYLALYNHIETMSSILSTLFSSFQGIKADSMKQSSDRFSAASHQFLDACHRVRFIGSIAIREPVEELSKLIYEIRGASSTRAYDFATGRRQYDSNEDIERFQTLRARFDLLSGNVRDAMRSELGVS